MANIKFSGNIGKEPELRFTPEGKAQISFSVALYTGKDKEGNQNPSIWARVYAFGETAEAMGQALHKGSKVTVEGTPRPARTWVDKEGVEHPAGLEVTAWSWAEGDAFRPDAVHPGQASEF
jgi:single-strand DNA-binding protein